MKILAIGRNYSKHIDELGNEREEEPVVFIKPDTALLKDNASFFYPDFSTEIHYEVELIIRINKDGKNIDKRFAHNYYNEIGVGIDFTARDLQQKAKEKRLPWTLSKGFNGSAPVSNFLPLEEFDDINNIDFSLKVNNILKQKGNSQNMIFNFDYIISYISKFITLKKGDIVFTGTPEGVGPIHIGDNIEAYIEDKKMLGFDVR
ncbi:MAG: fumarylacetoacetate hydrolase family protein [Bacteroidetes bacterium]|nr:fumarylacetoacetate hydrolase family protein [Bacteroidota bacterium]